jgi:hypothetical protein
MTGIETDDHDRWIETDASRSLDHDDWDDDDGMTMTITITITK